MEAQEIIEEIEREKKDKFDFRVFYPEVYEMSARKPINLLVG